MTKTSLESLQGFLRTHNAAFFDDMRIADFGGTDNIGMNTVKDMLATGGLTNYHMLDFDNGVDLRKPIKGKKFDLGICMDLLEHVSNPFTVAENIYNSLNKGAYLFVTAPFVWEIHGHPEDYWRFTPQGLRELFAKMEFETIFVENDKPKQEKGHKMVVPVGEPWSRVVGVFKKV